MWNKIRIEKNNASPKPESILSFVLYSLASKEDVHCKPFTVHWMGQLSVVPRSSGNPCAVDCHTEFSTTNRKWRHCFSVQVRSTFLTVLARLTLQEKKSKTHAKWSSCNGANNHVILGNSACCHMFYHPPT